MRGHTQREDNISENAGVFRTGDHVQRFEAGDSTMGMVPACLLHR